MDEPRRRSALSTCSRRFDSTGCEKLADSPDGETVRARHSRVLGRLRRGGGAAARGVRAGRLARAARRRPRQHAGGAALVARSRRDRAGAAPRRRARPVLGHARLRPRGARVGRCAPGQGGRVAGPGPHDPRPARSGEGLRRRRAHAGALERVRRRRSISRPAGSRCGASSGTRAASRRRSTTSATCRRLRGDRARSKEFVEESLALFRGLGDERGIAHALILRAELAADDGDHARARSLVRGERATVRGDPGPARALARSSEPRRHPHETGRRPSCREALRQKPRAGRGARRQARRRDGAPEPRRRGTITARITRGRGASTRTASRASVR